MLRETEEKNRLKSRETRNGFIGAGEDINVFYLAMESSLPSMQSYLVISDGCVIMLSNIHMGL